MQELKENQLGRHRQALSAALDWRGGALRPLARTWAPLLLAGAALWRAWPGVPEPGEAAWLVTLPGRATPMVFLWGNQEVIVFLTECCRRHSDPFRTKNKRRTGLEKLSIENSVGFVLMLKMKK